MVENKGYGAYSIADAQYELTAHPMFLDLEHLGDELRHQREKSFLLIDTYWTLKTNASNVERSRVTKTVVIFQQLMLVRNTFFPFSQCISMTIQNISFENNTGGLHVRSVMSANPDLNDLLACSVIGPIARILVSFQSFLNFLLKDSFIEV